jgi:hypothetical protein
MNTTALPVLVHVRVAGTDLRAALGSHQQPATLVFTSLVITTITPTSAIRIPATARAQPWPGIHQTGLRPRDADLLRDAAATADVADFALTARTLTLTTAHTTVTVDRW